MTAAELVVRSFMGRVNDHEPARIIALCTPEHRFIDSLGAVLTGHRRLHEAWSGYFAMFPDYHIEVESLVAAAGLVLVAGWASGTLAAQATGAVPRSWRIPAAWRAEVRGDLVDLWQVYADNKPVYELVAGDLPQ